MSRALPPRSDMATHEVLNQPGPRGDADLWATDAALGAAIAAGGCDALSLAHHAAVLGRAEVAEAARTVNRQLPELRLFDSGGRRLDEVAFHPAYHDFLRLGLGEGYAALPWEGQPGGHVTHAGLVYLHSQVEPASCCPMTMTYAAAPVLAQADLPDPWFARATSRAYDPAIRPVAEKEGATIGMAMTEKQGGSDLRANATRAERDGEGWRLTGHKWFCSAPMSDAFLTLAQAPGGLTCFLVPRWLPGERNAVRLMRLKDKLGNRANASAEIEYEGAFACQLGDEGRGIPTIIEMVHHTRLDTAVAPAGIMRAALAEAVRWCQGRTVFQKRLIDQPLMRAVLADLALDWEGAVALGFRVARAFDGRADGDRAFARIAVALAKYLANKRCVAVVAEAMEVLGGMGYVEDTPLPLLYREAPLNGIWEGSGNVIALDVLRTLTKEPLAAAALQDEFRRSATSLPELSSAVDAFRARWPGDVGEADARGFADHAARLLTACALAATAPPDIARSYISGRLGEGGGLTFGTARGIETGAVLARLAPAE